MLPWSTDLAGRLDEHVIDTLPRQTRRQPARLGVAVVPDRAVDRYLRRRASGPGRRGRSGTRERPDHYQPIRYVPRDRCAPSRSSEVASITTRVTPRHPFSFRQATQTGSLVALGQIGIILALEVSRLARHNAGRQPLDRGRNRKIASFRTAARRRLELDDHNIWTDHSLGESR
jgi:hypothetical protein